MAQDVAHYIRLVHPQVVVTFDPIGGYRHPDHIHIHQATVLGFTLAGDPAALPGDLPAFAPRKLFFQTIPRGFLKIAVKALQLFGRDPRKFGKNGDIDLLSLTTVSFPTNAVIDFTPVAKIRDEASACHTSQGGQSMSRGVQGFITRLFRKTETYMRAVPEVRQGEK